MKRLPILALTPLTMAPLTLAPLLASPALAQTPAPQAWTGEGVFGAGVTTGNTDTEDFSIAVRGKHTGGFWSQSGEITADYGETDDIATKERYAAALQSDFLFGDHTSAFVRGTWEHDEFSGFENRYFVGAGLAYKLIVSEPTQWILQGGPGYRIDELRPIAPVRAQTEESFGATAGSRFQHKFSPGAVLTNDTEVTYADTSTQYKNTLALTFDIIGAFKARISYEIRHETDPLPGFKANDTASRFSLVYKVG